MSYLDNAATSFPKPERVYARIDEVLRKISGNPGRASHRMALEASRVIFGARESAARLLGIADSSRISFTKNATEAINVALKGLLRPGDHAVTTTFEHNSAVKAFYRLERSGVEVTKVAPDAEGLVSPASVMSAVRKNTKVVCIAHASNVFGTVQPVEEMGRALRSRGVVFMVDAAQTAGAMPLDVTAMGVNVLAATGHKALFGPQGTGFLYMEEGIEPEPLIDGGTGEAEAALELPERLEAGTMNTPGVGGLGSGIEFVLEERVSRIRKREEELVGALIKGLSVIEGVSIIGPRDASRRASLVSFTLRGRRPSEVGMRLDEDHGIMIRTGTHCAPEAHRQAGTFPDGASRVSPGYFTTDAEIGAFLEAIKGIAAL